MKPESFFIIFLLGTSWASVGERSTLCGRINESGFGQSRSENVSLSSENIGENPMPRKPKGSLNRFVR